MSLLKSKNFLIFIFLFFIGSILWVIPHPEELTPVAWHFFIIFIMMIATIIVNPYPMGAIALLSALICIITQTLPLEQVMASFSSSISWLVVFAFFISRGFIKTGLGKRCAYYLISKIGSNIFGLSYSLIFTELLLAPAMPSATARGGGIIFPIAKSLSEEYEKNNLKNRIGGFLIQVCFQSNVITSAMFLTAIATNPLVASLAKQIGVEIAWGTWAIGAIVPGLISLIVLPFVVYFFYPPHVEKIYDAATNQITKQFEKISFQEIIMIGVFIVLIVFWSLGKSIGIDATTTALLGVSILILTGGLSWKDALQETSAWDCFIWFSILVMMSEKLIKFGIIQWIITKIQNFIMVDYILLSAIILALFYFYIHYIFASATAHATVLYVAFAILLIKLGVPKILVAMCLAYFSILSGGLTHFSIGSAPVFYESGYLSIQEWWKIGAIVSFVNILIWSTIGAFWWHYLGWW